MIEYSMDGSVLVRVPKDFAGKLVIPEGVIEIGEAALIDCSELTEVQFPSTLRIIGDYAFKHCINLESVDIPNSVEKIGRYAFSFCHSLENVKLPNNLSIIESGAFRNTQIERIVIPDSVNKIESDAFEDCYYLNDVQLPKDIEIEDSAFKGCSSMHQADALYLGLYGNPHYKLVKVFPHAKDYLIPNDVVEIGSKIFDKNYKVGHLVIPDSVRKIHDRAFCDCKGLESVTIGQGVTSLGRHSFSGCTSLKEVVILSLIKTLPFRCFYRCDRLDSIVMSDSVNVIADSCFEGCSGLISFELPSQLIVIGDNAFKDCINLRSVKFNDTLLTINEKAFYNCSSIQVADLPETLREIGISSFERCSSLTRCYLGSNITSVPYRSFSGCISLTEIVLSPTLATIADQAFLGCSELSAVNINESVVVGQDAFSGTAICDEHLKTKYKYYGKILPSQWKSDTPSGDTRIKVYRGFFVDDIETAERIIDDIKQRGLYHEQIESVHKEGRGHEKLDKNRLDAMYADKDVLSNEYEGFCKEYVYFGDYVCAMNYALRGGRTTIPIVIEAEMELDKLNVDGVDSFNHIFIPESNNALVRQVFGEKIDLYYEKCRAESINTDDDKSREIKRVVCDMAMSDNDIVYAFYKNSKCIHGKCGNLFRSAFQAKLPVDSSRISSVSIVSRDYTFPESDISLMELR